MLNLEILNFYLVWWICENPLGKIWKNRTVECRKLKQKNSDCFFSVLKQFLCIWNCRFMFGWLQAIWFCVAHGHTSFLPIFVTITSRCSQSLLWRFSAASSGSFSVLKMSGTRWITNPTCSSLWVKCQTRKINYFIPWITMYRLENRMIHVLNILTIGELHSICFPLHIKNVILFNKQNSLYSIITLLFSDVLFHSITIVIYYISLISLKVHNIVYERTSRIYSIPEGYINLQQTLAIVVFIVSLVETLTT